MKEINELIKHLQENQDAVIIIGEYLEEEQRELDYSSMEDRFNRRVWARDPESTFKYFMENIYAPKELNLALLDIAKIPASKVFYQSSRLGMINNSISLNGSYYKFICKCGITYTIDYVNSKEPYECHCEVCGKVIKPEFLLSNEKRKIELVADLKKSIDNASALILIGADMSTDKDVVDAIKDFKKTDSSKVLVTIQDEEEVVDINDMCFSDFVVKGDIAESIKRLTNKIKEGVLV